MKIIFISIIAVIFSCGCSNRNMTDELRAKYALNDTTKTFKVYRDIKLGSDVSFVDSIIKLDTQCYNINRTQLYKNRESMMYIKHGLIESLYVSNGICTESEIDCWGLSNIEKNYEYQIKRLLENLQGEPAYQSIFLDYLLNENCYRASMVLPINNILDKSEYIELDGWFSYKECNDRIFELTCIFDKYIDNEEQLKKIVDSFLRILSKKYGKMYNLDNPVIFTIKDDYSWCYKAPYLLYPTNKYAWLVGGYEVQFFCNRYPSNKIGKNEYEFVVKYIDNKFIQFAEKKYLEYKANQNSKSKKKYNEDQKELEKKFQNVL